MACQSLPLSEKVTGSPITHGTDRPPPVHQELNPGFLTNQAPRLGLILGGGGALGFAHIGVLQELEKQKIPVHAIAGLEWGSLVAGAYALKNKAHAIEWKLLKLPIEKFEKRSFFKKGQKTIHISEMDSFLDELFLKNRFDDLEIPFACPFGDLRKEKIKLQSRGSLKSGIKACWPHPPHFAVEEVAGTLNAVPLVVRFLKSQGADIVVYVDVSSSNRLMSQKDHEQNPQVSLLWTQHKAFVDWIETSLVDDIIRLSLPGDYINSYRSLRALVRMGQIKSQSQIKSLSKKHHF